MAFQFTVTAANTRQNPLTTENLSTHFLSVRPCQSELDLSALYVDTVKLPSVLTFLIRFSIKRAPLSFGIAGGKWSTSEFTIAAGSTPSLQLCRVTSHPQHSFRDGFNFSVPVTTALRFRDVVWRSHRSVQKGE